MLDDFAFWQRAVGEMNPTWANLLMGGGAVLIGLSLLILIERHWVFIRTNAKALAILALAPLMLALIGGGIYYLVFVHDPTKTVWIHPALSPAEQKQAQAECQMKAYEAIEGSRISQDMARSNYFDACLVSRGFVSREVKASTLENAQ